MDAVEKARLGGTGKENTPIPSALLNMAYLKLIQWFNWIKVLHPDKCGDGRPIHRFLEAVILPNSTSPPGPLSNREGEILCNYNNIS